MENDVRTFVENAQKLTEQGERANVDAVLQVSMSANYKLYEKMKRRYPEMCEAMRRLMKDEIADEMKEARREGWRRGQEEGREKGREEGREEGQKVGEMKKAREMALSLADMGIPAEKIAEAAKVSVKLVQEWLSGSVNVAR